MSNQNKIYMDEGDNPNLEEKDLNEEKVRDDLKTDKAGFIKVGDIILLLMKKDNYCGMISADGVISQSVTVIPRESDSDKGANILTRSCLFRIENATKITREVTKKRSESELKQLLGKPLTYGEKIQLRHLHSSSFISVFTQSMASEAGCLQVSMTEESDEKSWFEITATNKLRKEGEVIRYRDSVCLVMISNKSQYYLHADERNLNANSRADVNASGLFSPWMIRRFLSYELFTDTSTFVRTGDSFRIKHHISGGFLCTKDCALGEAPELFIQEGNLTSNSLWEIQRTATFFGGTAKWNEEYRIKHVATGRFLQETSEGILLTLKGYGEGTLFSFISDQVQNQKDIQFGSMLAIKTQKNRFFNLEISEVEKTHGVDKRKLTKKQRYKINLLTNVKNFTGVAFLIEDVAEVKTAHVYKLSLVSPYLTSFIDYISSLPISSDIFDINPDKFKIFEEKCREFTNLINNISDHIILKPNAEVDLLTRQNAIREVGMIDILVKISSEVYNKLGYKDSCSFHINLVLNKVYSLIYNSLKSNMKNCKYLFLKESILLSQLEFGLKQGIGKLLKEIFKNSTVISSLDEKNFQIWYNFLKPVTKGNLKEQMLYLSILQYLCSANTSGERKYQALALKNLTNPQTDFTVIKFDYLNKRPVIELDFPKKNMDLNLFLEHNLFLKDLGVVVDEQNFLAHQVPLNGVFYVEDISKSEIYSSYLSHAIEFLSSICMSRYSKAITQIQTVTGITLEHIGAVLRNVNLSDKLRAAYATLCRVLFIDIDLLLPCSLHKERCYIWDNLQKFDDQVQKQRKEMLRTIRDILRYFWDKDGGVKITSNNEGRSIKLIIAFTKLARTIIDLELEDEDFIEFFMQPLCFFMMKDCGIINEHWSIDFINSVNKSLESNYKPELENKLSLFYLEILEALDVIVNLRQNFHVLELIVLFKKNFERSSVVNDENKEKFVDILQRLDWDISVKYPETELDLLGMPYTVEKERVYNMDLYLLELLFDVSGGKNKEIHSNALRVLIQDITQRYVLSNEMRNCEFLFDEVQIDLYRNILLLVKRLQKTVTLLVQEKNETHDSSQVNEAIKDSVIIIQDCINMYKTSGNKLLFQNLLNHSGIHHLLIQILNLHLGKSYAQLFQVTIAALHLFSKKNKTNQSFLIRHLNRLLELIPQISITRLICEILADKRQDPKGELAINSIFDLINTEGFSIEYAQFLRGFLRNFDMELIKPLQIQVLKSIFQSEGIRKIMGDESLDIFAVQYFLDPALLNSVKFEFHLEVIKIVISCSIQNPFGILQGRKLMSFNSIKHCLFNPEIGYKGKQVYLKFMQLMYFCRIEGEIEYLLNINVLDQIIKEVLIPDLLKIKASHSGIIEISRKGGFALISKNNLRKKAPKLSNYEQDLIEYWTYLSQKPTWFDESIGLFSTFSNIFKDNSMKVDSVMEVTMRELKVVLYEINDVLQFAESQNTDINFSRYILAANNLREVLPKTALYSNKPSGKFSDNVVIAAIQKHIIDNKLTLDEAFQAFDTDGSGTIEFEEFRIIVRKILGNISSTDIEIAFNQIDEDHSGTLVISELERIIRKYFSKHPRMVKVKKEEETNDDNQEKVEKDEIKPPEKVNESEKVKFEFEKFCSHFYETCKEDDLKKLVQKIKEKYMEPVNVSLTDSITKLGLVFYKTKHKIYLIKILRMLIPNFKPADSIFDERNLEEEILKKEFIRCQGRLSDAGVLKIALDLISHTNSITLIEETVHLLISLLRFGNIKIQSTFLGLLKNQINSEMFAYIRNLLRETRDVIIKRNSDRFLKDPENSIQQTLILSENVFSDPEKNHENRPFLVEHMLNLLQMCCENCFGPFQHFLRVQETSKIHNKQISINMVDEIVTFLVNVKQIGGCLMSDPQAVSLVIQAFETLIDVCKGPCIENQMLLGSKKKLYKFVNSILKLYSINKNAKDLFKSAVRYLESLLEGNFSLDIAKTMIDCIDFDLLAKQALQIYIDYIQPKKTALLQDSIVGTNSTNTLLNNIKSLYQSIDALMPELELEEWDLISVGFKITIITVKLREKFRTIDELRWLCFSDDQPGYKGEAIIEDILSGIDLLGGYNESIIMDLKKFLAFLIRLQKSETNMNEAYEFYTSLISSVEIDKDGKIEKCYFQIPSAMVYLSQQMRNSVIYGIDRNSNEEKIKSFFNITERKQLELNHLQIIGRIGFLGWMISRYDFFAKVLFFAIICANFIVIGTVTSLDDQSYNTSNFQGQGLMIVLGILIMGISVIMYCLSILVSYPMIIFDKAHSSQDSSSFPGEKNAEIQGTIKMNNLIESTSKSIDEELQNFTKYISYVLFNIENLVNIGIVVLAILGWYNPFFYAIMMLDILRRSETLKNVLLVITKNKKSLILTVVLLIIIVYIFAVWGFVYMSEYYTEAVDGTNYQSNTYCYSLLDCVTSTLSYGIRAGGGIGDAIFPAYQKDKYYELRLVFDILFFIIVIIIMLNIFFGIIVDTFAELRDARREMEHDIENFCFVCGRPKHEFELRGSGWNQHIQIEHNIWAYMGYIIYIKRKPITECDGIEKYVKNKLAQNDITFFPTTALCLEVGKEKIRDVAEILEEDLEEIENTLEEVGNKISG